MTEDSDTIEFEADGFTVESFFDQQNQTPPASFGAATHVGRVRERNEDQFAIFRRRRNVELLTGSLPKEELPDHEAVSYVLVVADGMGGMRSGDLASSLALKTMLQLTGQATSWVTKLTSLTAQQIERRVDAYIQKTQEAIERRSRLDTACKDMGTTWTSAHLLGSKAVIVHLGDSRAYFFGDGQLHQITDDQTVAQSLIDAGMAPEDVDRFRHILLNSFGGGNEKVHASIYCLDLEPGNQLLLCTDGLTDMVSDESIADQLRQSRTPQQKCEALVEQALANGGKDNVTLVLAEIGAA